VPQCAVCAVPATAASALCQVVLYCGRDHQKQDFEAHKRVCKRAKQCRELMSGSASLAERRAGHVYA
jgi:hypothetical protein